MFYMSNAADYNHTSIVSLFRGRKKLLLQVMKYEDPLNWKKINSLEILLYKAKLTWTSQEKKKKIIIYGEVRW